MCKLARQKQKTEKRPKCCGQKADVFSRSITALTEDEILDRQGVKRLPRCAAHWSGRRGE